MNTPHDALEEILAFARENRTEGDLRIDELAGIVRNSLPAEARWRITAPAESGRYWARVDGITEIVRVIDEHGTLRIEKFGTDRADRIARNKPSPVRWWSESIQEPPAG